MSRIVSYLTLFTSLSTLVCCALPLLFVSLGMGAALVGLVTTFPQLIWISENKSQVFLIVTVMLLFSGWLLWRAQFQPCPIEPELRRACLRSRQLSLWIWIVSVVIAFCGSFFAFVLPSLK